MNMDNSKRGRGQAIKSGGFALPPSSVCSPCSRLPSAGGGRGLVCAWPSSFASVFQSRQAIEAALGSGLKQSVVWVNAVQFKSYPVRLDIFLQSRDQEEAVLAVLQRKRWQLGLDRVKIHENYHARKRKEGLPGDWWEGATKGMALLGVCTLNLHGGLVHKKAELAVWKI